MKKRVFIWIISHLLVASVVTDWMRREGRTEEEAKLVGHAAGAAAGYFLSRA
jgi:hypothetical protein